MYASVFAITVCRFSSNPGSAVSTSGEYLMNGVVGMCATFVCRTSGRDATIPSLLATLLNHVPRNDAWVSPRRQAGLSTRLEREARRSWRNDSTCSRIELGTAKAGSEGDNDTHLSDPAFTEADQQIIQRIRAPQLGSVEWFEAQKKKG